MRKTIRIISIMVFLSSVVACRSPEELASGLSAQQAVDLVVSLRQAGVASERRKHSVGNKETFSVYTSLAQRDQALSIIHDRRLLDMQSSDKEFFGRSADPFTPVARELANLRLDRALSMEAERILQKLPGVITAHVSIRSFFVPDSASRGTVSEQPKAAVVIHYYSKSGNQPFQSDEVRRLISTVVPGIRSESISLTSVRDTVTTRSDIFEQSSGASIDMASEYADLGIFSLATREEDKTQVLAFLFSAIVGILFAGAVSGAALVWWQFRPKGKRNHKPLQQGVATLTSTEKRSSLTERSAGKRT